MNWLMKRTNGHRHLPETVDLVVDVVAKAVRSDLGIKKASVAGTVLEPSTPCSYSSWGSLTFVSLPIPP